MTDKELIKQEIESYKESMKGLEPHSDFRRGQLTAYNQIMQFIDSIPEEPISEDLEEAAKEYVKENCILPEDCNDGEIPYYEECTAVAFKAGAEWQKQKDQETIELAEDHAILAGMNRMKEEMMGNAVDGYISLCHDYPHRRSLVAIEDGLVNFEYAEKVKIIIYKPEQQ